MGPDDKRSEWRQGTLGAEPAQQRQRQEALGERNRGGEPSLVYIGEHSQLHR